jgi:hypothetical protein
MTRFWPALAALLFVAVSAAFAESAYAPFAALLVDRDGWTAPPATGSAMDMGGVKMVTAERHYAKGDRTFDVTYLSGSAAVGMAGMADQDISIETSDGSMKTSTVGGYRVMTTIDKTHGTVLVWFGKESSAALITEGKGADAGTLLDFAKGFDWRAMAAAGKGLK